MRAALWSSLIFCAAPAMAATPAQIGAPYREGEVIVRYRAATGAPVAKSLKAGLGARSKLALLDGRAELLDLPSMLTTAGALEILRADPAVAHAEPNFLRYPRQTLPNDPLFGQQWGLHSTGQANFVTNDPALASIPGADLNLLAAWDPDGDGVFDRVGDRSVTVAVIDDAFLSQHVDLAPNMAPGFDFASGDADPSPTSPDEIHGTWVAGCVGAAGNNGVGVAGAAWNVRLMPLRFAFDTASHLRALEFARDNGADIVNASFGGPGFSQLELDAIRELGQRGILYVAAAGNDDSNTDFAQLNYPANYDAPNIVTVAATNRQDQVVSFSQYGALSTDVAAPGLQIVTTDNGNGYTTNPGVAGTSFAAPYVAGIAALIKSHVTPRPAATEIKARLIEGAEAGDGVSLRTAGGRVNAAASLDLAPRPALVIRSVALDGNGVLDPGETTTLTVTLENLWTAAAGVGGTLSADQGLAAAGAAGFGDIAAGGAASAVFTVTVPPGIDDHRYVAFTLALSAGGYSAQRRFQLEVGRLPLDATRNQSFAGFEQNLYDEFHAWHVDLGALPPGHNQLVIETTTATDHDANGTRDDIDLLARFGSRPAYLITVGLNPETGTGFFCTSGTTPDCMDPATFVSGERDGDEQVVINNPAPGAYHIVVVNFAQLDQPLPYTLRAFTRHGVVPGTGGGGSVPVSALAIALLGWLWRRHAV